MVPVLVIDHDKERLAGTTGVLSRHGYCPLGARFDSDAMALLSEIRVDIALIECQAAADHAALVDSIRRRHPRVAVIAVVDGGRTDGRAMGSALDTLGVAAIVQRPFHPATLINAVGHRVLDALAA